MKPTRVDFYVLQNVLRPMRNIFIFVLLILECVRFRVGLGLAIHQDNFFALVFTYLSQWLALYAGLALQFALAIGVMLGFSRLAQNRELDAMHALGFSLHRLLIPVLALAAIVAAIDAAILGWAQPVSLYNSGSFVHQVQKLVNLLPEGGDMFYTTNEKTVLIDGIAPKTNHFNKIFVYQTFADGKTLVTAGTQGQLNILEDDPQQYYDVSNVHMMQVAITHEGATRQLPVSFNASTSAHVQGPVQVVDTSAFRKRGASEWEMTLDELAIAKPPNGYHVNPIAMQAELNYRMAQIIFIFMLPLIAVLFVIEPKRNPSPFRFLGGLLVILGFHQCLGIGASFARSGQIPPLLCLWVPLALLATVCFVLFRRLSVKPGFSSAR